MFSGFNNTLIRGCICGNTQRFKTTVINDIPVAVCRDCGVVHQHLENFTADDLYDFYHKEYHQRHQNQLGRQGYRERYANDKNVADQRLKKYAPYIVTGRRGIDIGSANNAFVDSARKQGYECWGVEPSDELQYPKTTYHQAFEHCAFPQNWADFITLHDVLEHMIDPRECVRHIGQVLKKHGLLIVDFPDFFQKEGRHHWRPIQHLWYLDQNQLTDLIVAQGFELIKIDRPIPGKLVFYFRNIKDMAQPTRFLMLPGMGDIYWTMVKMQSFCEKHAITNPVVDIWDFDDRPRSRDYVERIPFVTWGDYHVNKDFKNLEFNETYHTGPRSIFPGFHDYDYYMGVNGVLRMGHSLDDPALDIGQYDSDWYFPFHTSLEEESLGSQYRKKWGPYILTHFSNLGMFKHWERMLRPVDAYEILKLINDICGRRVVLTGKHWDSEYNRELLRLDKRGILIDQVDQTELPEFLAMMKYSDGMFGWCGGNTIKSTYFRKPTVMLWTDYFPDPRFFVNCVPPDSVQQWYWPIDISRRPLELVVDAVMQAWGPCE